MHCAEMYLSISRRFEPGSICYESGTLISRPTKQLEIILLIPTVIHVVIHVVIHGVIHFVIHSVIHSGIHGVIHGVIHCAIRGNFQCN